MQDVVDLLQRLEPDQIREAIDKREAEVRALRVLLDAAEAKHKPARKPGRLRMSELPRADAVEDFLRKSGPANPTAIAAGCCIPITSVTGLLRSKRFLKTDGGYTVAAAQSDQ